MLKLFDHPMSPYAQKVKLALYEKSIPFDVVVPDFIGGDAAFYAASPRREVPTLVDGDVKIFDSSIILEYLEETYPQPAIRPASPAARARARMIEEICDTYFDAVNWGLLEVRFFKRATGELAAQIERRAQSQIEGLYAWLESSFGSSFWLNGDSFGWADIAAIPHVTSSVAFGIAPAESTQLAAWFAHASERKGVMLCNAAAAAAVESYSAFPDLVQSGIFPREYRDHRLDWMMRSGGEEIVRAGMAQGNIRFSLDIDPKVAAPAANSSAPSRSLLRVSSS